ncbi:MAG: serine/threonine protein kinase [Chloroflexi bacterium]|nr:serine/threonine protein kinase [Chloroflexota bacterium]
MLNAGSQLQGRYNIVQFIGQGGMAAVYLGADTRLGNRHIAIKEMNPANLPPADQPWAITAFQQEAEVLARLNHPTIARVVDFFQENQYWYLVMEYVQGEALDTALNRFPHGLAEDQVLNWAAQLAGALDYLHQQNPPVIFRDLKPGNVMVQPDGTLKLIDFGIARYFKAGQSQDTYQLGTPGYAAPEQYGRGQTDARSDVYSLGVLLHQLLTGYDPSLSPMNLPPVRSLRPDVSVRVAQAVEQAMRTDPSQRYASVREFAAALGISISGMLPPPSSPPPSTSFWNGLELCHW